VIRVVLVKEENDWLPFFGIDPQVTPREILETMADRGAEEQTFKDVKAVWGAGQQPVRHVASNEGCVGCRRAIRAKQGKRRGRERFGRAGVIPGQQGVEKGGASHEKGDCKLPGRAARIPLA
jgi:hypothetical protein